MNEPNDKENTQDSSREEVECKSMLAKGGCVEKVISGGASRKYFGANLRQCANKGKVQTPSGLMCKLHAKAAGYSS